MAGTRLTDENKALNTSNPQSTRRRRMFGQYFGTIAVAFATAVSTLGGNIMVHASPQPVEAQREDRTVVTARSVLERDIAAINQYLANMKAAGGDMGVVVHNSNKLVLALLADLVAQNSALKKLNGDKDVFPISGKTPQEQFASLIAWIEDGKPVTDGLTPKRLETLDQKISGVLSALNNAILAARDTVLELEPIVPERRDPAEAGRGERRSLDKTVPRPVVLTFTDPDYIFLSHALALIRDHPKTPKNGETATQHLTNLEGLYNNGKPDPAKIAELNALYKEAKRFASGPVLDYATAEGRKAKAKELQREQVLLTIENERFWLNGRFSDRDLASAMRKLDEAKRLADSGDLKGAIDARKEAGRLARAAPKKVTTIEDLTLIAISDPDSRRRLEAVAAQNNLAALDRIAKESKFDDTKLAASDKARELRVPPLPPITDGSKAPVKVPPPATARAEERAPESRTAEPAVVAEQAYLTDMAQKTAELARITLASLEATPIPKQKDASDAREAAIRAVGIFKVEAERLAEATTLTFDEVSYKTALLRADTVETMALLLRFAKDYGMDRASAKFFDAYTDLAVVISQPNPNSIQADDKLGGFYVEVSKLAPDRKGDNVVETLANLRATRIAFYADYLDTVDRGVQLTIDQGRFMLERAIIGYSVGRDPKTDPLLIAASIWKDKCADPMVLYAMAHNLVSIREAEVWLYTETRNPFTVDPSVRIRLTAQLDLAKQAFLWNYKDDFTNPAIRVDPTYYPNMSTTLAEDVTHYLVPTLRFTEPYAGFYASVGAAQTGPGFTSAVNNETRHVSMLLAMKYPFPSDPWLETATPKGLDRPLSIHHAFEFGEGPYAVQGLVSRSKKVQFDTGLPRISSGRERVYYLGPVTDLHQDHDAPGYAHNGLGAAVLRREAVLVGDESAPALLKSAGFEHELGVITAEFMRTGDGNVALLKLAGVRIKELQDRLDTIIEGDDVPIKDLPSKAPDNPRIFYIQRAQEALQAARKLQIVAGANSTTAKLALEVAELGLAGLGNLEDIYTPPVAAPVEKWDITRIKLDVRDFEGNDHIYATTTAKVRIEQASRTLKEYATAEGYANDTDHVMQYNWQFYSTFKDGNVYLLNPKYGEPGQPMFLGRVMRGMTFSDGISCDAVAFVIPRGSGWEVLGGESNPAVAYRLMPSASPTDFVPVQGDAAGSIDPLLFTVSTKSDKPDNGHMLFNHAKDTYAGVVLTAKKKE